METTRRSFMQLLGVTGASALVGCESATDALARLLEGGLEQGAGDFRPPTADEIDPVTHALNRLTWGPRPGEYRRVTAIGIDAFIDEQLDPGTLDDRGCDWRVASIETVHEPAAELYEYSAQRLLTDLTRQKLLRGVYSNRQLFEVMVDFWSDHLNIASGKDDCRWLKVADEQDVVRAHALGRFRDLIGASAVSPAMLIYLDGHDNKVEQAGERPNENYARELLELHTLGVDGGYSQRDVMEVARCLSGWTYEHEPFRFRAARVGFEPGRHDAGQKRVLGHVIPAGGGVDDLERVLDIVCGHASTARYVATKLCRRFIDDQPPDDAVAAVAGAFTASDGDIAITLRALFATDAFRARRGSMLKRPLRYVLSALRGVDARTNCSPQVMRYLERMGHAPFQYPSPDGYPMEPAPWLGTLLWRWNFALALVTGRLDGTRLDAAALMARLGGADGAAAHLLGRRPGPTEAEILQGAGTPLALALASPAFQFH